MRILSRYFLGLAVFSFSANTFANGVSISKEELFKQYVNLLKAEHQLLGIDSFVESNKFRGIKQYIKHDGDKLALSAVQNIRDTAQFIESQIGIKNGYELLVREYSYAEEENLPFGDGQEKKLIPAEIYACDRQGFAVCELITGENEPSRFDKNTQEWRISGRMFILAVKPLP